MASRATIEITEVTRDGQRGNHLLMDCTVEWSPEHKQWRARSDDGSEVFDDFGHRAAILCLALRCGFQLEPRVGPSTCPECHRDDRTHETDRVDLTSDQAGCRYGCERCNLVWNPDLPA